MKTKKAYFQIGVMKTKIGCSDQALMPRKRKILTHVWYQNKLHIKIFKDGFPDFSFYPPTAFWEGLKRGHKPSHKFVLVRKIPALVRLNKRTVSFSFQQFFISFSIIYCLHFTISNNSELSYQLIHELRFYKFIFSNTMVDYFDTYVNQITL